MKHSVIKYSIIAAVIIALYVIGYFAVGDFRAIDRQEHTAPVEGETLSASETVFDNPIDINSVSAHELDTLPGIGEKKANAIVKMREEMCGYKSLEDILCADGIGEGILEKIRPFIKVGEYKKDN